MDSTEAKFVETTKRGPMTIAKKLAEFAHVSVDTSFPSELTYLLQCLYKGHRHSCTVISTFVGRNQPSRQTKVNQRIDSFIAPLYAVSLRFVSFRFIAFIAVFRATTWHLV